jgi:hypothetical protein
MAKKIPTAASEAPTPPPILTGPGPSAAGDPDPDTSAPAPPTDAETIASLRSAIDMLEAQKNGAYQERNKLLAVFIRCAIALNYEAWLGTHVDKPGDPPWDPEWRNVVYLLLPTGQVSWHIHDSELPLFAQLGRDAVVPYDGHSTEAKYSALLAWRPTLRRT